MERNAKERANVFREKLEFPELERAIIRLKQKYEPKIIFIEDKASGTALLQQLKRNGVLNVKAVKPEGDKVMRMREQSLYIENGAIILPSNASWLESYLHEMTVFPNGKHDDQVDSTSQALIWFGESLKAPKCFVRELC